MRERPRNFQAAVARFWIGNRSTAFVNILGRLLDRAWRGPRVRENMLAGPRSASTVDRHERTRCNGTIPHFSATGFHRRCALAGKRNGETTQTDKRQSDKTKNPHTRRTSHRLMFYRTTLEGVKQFTRAPGNLFSRSFLIR
jgi:hypothetical protein